MLHIDGDIVAYRIACAIGDDGEADTVGWTINSFMATKILVKFPELTKYHVYLSGSRNFRHDLAVTAPYKGNRDPLIWTEAVTPPKPKPVHLKAARAHLIDVWGATVSEDVEADDAIATAATQGKHNVFNTILSIDKDFDQLPIMRYNFVTGVAYQPTEDEALKTLYRQILTGDDVDNIIGVDGCGPSTASELIDGCTNEADMILICIDQLGQERFTENANLVYLLRKPLSDFSSHWCQLDYSVKNTVRYNT